MEDSLERAQQDLSVRFAEAGFCGFAPPRGWIPLVREIDARLAEENPDYRIGQVKEKFGGLRFYADNLTASQREFVRLMEERSWSICQNCGSRESVKLRRFGWVATLCAACASTGGEPPRGYHPDGDGSSR